MIQFLDQYKDIINILLGITTGVVLSIVGFLLTHRFNWRNYLTKEFTIKIRESYKEKTGSNITKLVLVYDINCTMSDELSINYVYFKMPKNFRGNTPPNATMGEHFFGAMSRHYIQTIPTVFKYYKSSECIILNKDFLTEISKGKVNKFWLIVSTNKYGDVKSNCLILNKNWYRRLIDKL